MATAVPYAAVNSSSSVSLVFDEWCVMVISFPKGKENMRGYCASSAAETRTTRHDQEKRSLNRHRVGYAAEVTGCACSVQGCKLLGYAGDR